MADYVYLKLSDGQLLKVLTDSSGVIQTSPNGDSTSFTGLAAATAQGATVSVAASLSGNGSSGSPLAVVSAPTATTATTATGPVSAAAFTAALNAATQSLQGMQSAADKLKSDLSLYPKVQALTDADITVTAGDLVGVYYLPAGTLTTARTVTIGDTGSPSTGWQATIAVLGAQGSNLVIKNSAGTTIFTVAAGKKIAFNSYWNNPAIVGNWFYLN